MEDIFKILGKIKEEKREAIVLSRKDYIIIYRTLLNHEKRIRRLERGRI